MADKLTWTDLRRVLAARAGVSEKKANAFLNAFQAQLVEALKSDKQVKINGLGSFKVQAVAPRKSVNVNTGEEILIEGYNKLAFTPEAGVKELVEKMQAVPQPLLEGRGEKAEIDPLKKLGEQAEEIVDILGDLGQSPKKETPLPEPVEEEQPLPDPSHEGEGEEPEPVQNPEPVQEPIKEPEPTPAPKPAKKYHFLRDTLICVVILLMILLAGYFFLRHELSDILQKLIQPADTEVVADTIVQPVEITEEPIEVAEPAVAEGAETQDVPAIQEAPKTQEYVYTDLITIEPMHKASRLAWMAKRYYGAKIYWPYLYDANRDVISDPNRIETGTPIRVPKLTKIQLDTTNAQTIATIEQLREEALRSGE